MDPKQLNAVFDQQASSYDHKWSRLAPVRDGLHLLIGSIFRKMPFSARVLCVGPGTGAEILYLAGKFPGWTFTGVEPSAGMLSECRRRAEEVGVAERCTFHEGYLDSLRPTVAFDAATSLLVSQFILEKRARSNFFRAIAEHLQPGGLLVTSDLSADVMAESYPGLLEVWLRALTADGVAPETIDRMCAAYRQDVAVLPPRDVEAIIASGGFLAPVQFYQAGLMHAWCARRAPRLVAN